MSEQLICKAVLNIKGEHFPCDGKGQDHAGWAHSNRAAEAVWGDADE